jgi:uncharacterized protein (TIGR03086 family)
MTAKDESTRVLSHALDQAGDVLDHVHPEVLDQPTPCEGWTVGVLADHLVAAPRRFLAMMRAEQPDWSAPPPHVTDNWGPTFRAAADDFIREWHELGGEGRVPPDWPVAELAVHSWDLATALGQPPIDSLEPEVAETALAFMRANLRAANRGAAFGPERPVADRAGPYERLAAFAGRTV